MLQDSVRRGGTEVGDAVQEGASVSLEVAVVAVCGEVCSTPLGRAGDWIHIASV